MTDKLKVGFYGITGCAGCQLSVLFNEEELPYLFKMIDVTAFPFIREKNIEQDFDFVFIEGLVASEDDLATIKRLRERTKVLVALGACAHTGCVPAYRHFTLDKEYAHLLYAKDKDIEDVSPSSVDMHVKVDYTIPGCPPNKNEILYFIKDIVVGKEPKMNSNPVCVECRQNGNICLIENKKLCLGPVTAGGCDAVCVNGGFECWGCRGSTDDANISAMVNLLESKGHLKESIHERMRIFAGLKIKKEAEEFFDENNKP